MVRSLSVITHHYALDQGTAGGRNEAARALFLFSRSGSLCSPHKAESFVKLFCFQEPAITSRTGSFLPVSTVPSHDQHETL